MPAYRVPKERPNATRLLQHPFLAGVGHKAAPPHGGLTLNTTIPPRVRQIADIFGFLWTVHISLVFPTHFLLV